MTVADVMTWDVISVSDDTPVGEVARALTGNKISAVPVVSETGRLLGIVSESDLIRRAEIGTEREPTWWRRAFPDVRADALDYVRTHGRKARHVMTSPAITATEDMALSEVARILEKRRLKRLPVVENGKLVGIVSRSDLVWALAQHRSPPFADPPTDEAAVQDIGARLKEVTPGHRLINVSVRQGVAEVSGLVSSAEERAAVIVAAENAPGVRSVRARLALRPAMVS